MMIHKELLTHDGVAYNSDKIKVIDLGFNGDFDVKNHAWNMVFVALPAYAGQSGPVTVTAYTDKAVDFTPGASTYTKDTTVVRYKGCLWLYTGTSNAEVASWDDSKFSKLDLAGVTSKMLGGSASNYRTQIGQFTIPEAVAKKGGAFGITMPKGLGRYFTLAVSGATAQLITAGITDMVDTDVNPGVDWTYYKADTAEVNQPGRIETAAAKLAEGPALTSSEVADIADTQIAAAAAAGTGG